MVWLESQLEREDWSAFLMCSHDDPRPNNVTRIRKTTRMRKSLLISKYSPHITFPMVIIRDNQAFHR
jgi:hypothetical protein